MPRRALPPRLLARGPRERNGRLYPGVWVIAEGRSEYSTSCGLGDRAGAERALAAYLAEKHRTPRHERHISEIRIADVIAIYLADVVPGQARPAKAAERAERLLTWWGTKTLSQVTGANCRAYSAARGNDGGARRDLQDLSAAIGHHHREGLHREDVRVVLPPKGEARQRWLTRDEAARLLWTCWRTREVQNGVPTGKRPLRHLARFLLLGLYTGSRPGAILNASWWPGPNRSFLDTRLGVFHRRADGAVETTKRQPTVRLAPRLLNHLRRWHSADLDKGATWAITFDGQPIKSIKTALGRAVKLAGIPGGVTAYTLRHTCASWEVQKGRLSTREIAEYLGTSEPMILRHYGHLSPHYQERAAAEIGRK